MSEIPEFYQYRKEEGEKSHLHPFSYRNDDSVFEIAGVEIPLADFDPYSFNPYLPEFGIDPDGIEIDDIPNHPALIPTFGNLLVGPKLHDWANQNTDQLLNVFKVMHKAYAAFYDDPSQISGEKGVGHMGFASGPREDGGIHLQVMGDCACMGPNYNSFYIRNQFENGYAEYDLHNADFQFQRASLYAGLGHLARRAAEAGNTLF
jgi:hypothetical protein